MNLFRAIALLMLLAAHCLPVGTFAASGDRMAERCTMACCADLEDEGLEACFCNASSDNPPKPMPASAPSAGGQERMPVVAWSCQRMDSCAWEAFEERSFSSLNSKSSSHVSAVELPVLFCTFLI